MSQILQSFLADATEKKAKEIVEAYLRLPQDKRQFKASENSRSAVNMIAEVTLMNGFTDVMVKIKGFPSDFSMEDYQTRLAELEADANVTETFLASLPLAQNAMMSISDDELSIEVPTPWATYTMAEILAFPYWNLSYHLGQINFIAMMLGVEV